MDNKIDSLFVELVSEQAKLQLHRLRNGRAKTVFGLYFIGCGDLVKIGKARDVNKRVAVLQTGCPSEIYLIDYFPKIGSRESEFHQRLSHLRVRGEWFRYTDEVLYLIKELKANGK